MRAFIRNSTLAPALAVALIAMACGGGDAATDEAARDIQLTPAAANAPVNDQPAAAAPAPAAASPAPAPTPAPAKAAPAKATPRVRTGTIASGTSFEVHNAARICTNSHKTGTQFTTTVAADVSGTNGAKIPAGAVVTLVVTESQISKNARDNWKLAFDVVNVALGNDTLAVTGDVTKVATIQAVRSQSTGQQAGKVATGAAVGAVAGQVLGKDTKSTLIGAAVGAAAGGAVAVGTADYEGCLAPNGTITVALTAPLTVRVAN